MKKRLKIPAFAFDSTSDSLGERGEAQQSVWNTGVQAVELWLLRKMLRVLGDPPVCLRLWDGRELSTSTKPSVGLITINSRAALHRLAGDQKRRRDRRLDAGDPRLHVLCGHGGRRGLAGLAGGGEGQQSEGRERGQRLTGHR